MPLLRVCRLASCFLLASAMLPAGTVAAQSAASDSAVTGRSIVLPLVGSADEERERMEQLTGSAPAGGYLLRSASSRFTIDPTRPGLSWALVLPVVRSAYNSDIPLSLNEGALWAGRGWSVAALAGVRAQYGRVAVILAPEFTYGQNEAFEIVPACASEDRKVVPWKLAALPQCLPGRDSLASPWYVGRKSIDLPQRFGGEPLSELGWGESSLSVAAGPVVAGISTERQWWGPGARNAIVLSANAPGFPHLFARTARPAATRFGTFEARWILGLLSTSEHFDTLSPGDRRSLSGAVATFSPAGEPGLTLGLARTVYSDLAGAGELGEHAADVFLRYAARPGEDGVGRGHDQMTSFFARWLFPQSGLEAYGEWARAELPGSLRDFLVSPHHALGYTLGLQWAREIGSGNLHLQGEVTDLEQSATFTVRPTPTFYVSQTVAGGYTHRGRTLGAAIGPGSSSQMAAADYWLPAWRLGASIGRIRWQEDAHVEFGPRRPYTHDVSTLAAVRIGHRSRHLSWTAELGRESRLNYMFLNNSPGFEPDTTTVDHRNYTVRLIIRPGSGR